MINKHFNSLNETEQINEELRFLRLIIDRSPAVVYINQVETIGDTSTMKNVWGNKLYHNIVKYTREEINMLGYEYFVKVMHPDELFVPVDSIDFLKNISDDFTYGGVGRIKPKGAEYYLWHSFSTRVFKRKKDGTPWQFIGVSFLLNENVQTDRLFLDIIKDNLKIRNQTLLKCISKREKEIIKLIANGNNTEEISKILNLSEHTINTHRKNILKKLELHNSTALVNFAVENGLN